MRRARPSLEGAMMHSEIEVELEALRRDLAQLQARDEARDKQMRPLVKSISFIVVLFTLAALFIIAFAVWTGRFEIMQFMYPILFTAISLSFLNSTLRAWRPAEVRAASSSARPIGL
jgi:hypothetical protein